MAKKKKATKKKAAKNTKSMWIAMDTDGEVVAHCTGTTSSDIKQLLEEKYNDEDLDEDNSDEITVFQATKAFKIEANREYDVWLRERTITEEG